MLLLKSGQRGCDVCDQLIPKGEQYRVTEMTPEAARIFFEDGPVDPDMLPSWTQKQDGTVCLDICMQCHKSMSSSGNARGES